MKSARKKIFAKPYRAVLAAIKFFLFAIVTVTDLHPATAAVPSHLAGLIYADYAAPLREATTRADGYDHVDTPALIQKLQAGNIKTYAFLVHSVPSDWDDFRLEFLPAAQAANLNVWLYLTPPSETSPVPYTSNYVAWATAAAQLAQTYPVLKGLAMDDFNGNESFFTPAYVSNMVAAAYASNTNFVFIPVNYDFTHNGISSYVTADISPAFANAYGPYCGGVIFPYLNWTNKDDYSDELFQISNNAAIMRGEVCQLLVNFPSSTRSVVGDFSALSQTITNAAGFPNAPYPFPIRAFDDYNGATTGYHQLQVLVDGVVVWSRDVSGTNGVQDIKLNLQAQLAGKTSATLTVRVYDAKAVSNFHVLASLNLPAGNWTKVEAGSFIGTGTYYLGTPGLNVPLITMIYDGGYGSGTNLWKPTTNYVREANLLAQTAAQNRVTIGIIQYKMDKTASSGQFPIVQQLYGQWAYRPQFNSIRRQPDGNVSITGTGGGPNIGYTLLAADSLSTPLISWHYLATNSFDINGNFSHNGFPTSEKPGQFYRISVP
jgi:hypothetical protein